MHTENGHLEALGRILAWLSFEMSEIGAVTSVQLGAAYDSRIAALSPIVYRKDAEGDRAPQSAWTLIHSDSGKKLILLAQALPSSLICCFALVLSLV